MPFSKVENIVGNRENVKAFDDDIVIFNFGEIMVIVSKSVENIAGKGENAGYQNFLLFTRFQKATPPKNLRFTEE